MANDTLYKSVRVSRGYLLQVIEGISDEKMLEVPEGAVNNVLWNLGHIVHAHDRFTYGACDVESDVPASYTDLFKGGTSPSDWDEPPSIEEVMGHIKNATDKTYSDYAAGKFDNYNAFELAPSLTIRNIDEALQFNCLHEGVHIGIILSLKRLIGVTI